MDTPRRSARKVETFGGIKCYCCSCTIELPCADVRNGRAVCTSCGTVLEIQFPANEATQR